PPGALNLPLLVTDPATGQMTHNPEFVIVARAVLDPSTQLIVGCASGQRSMMAIANFGDYGYICTNVSSGFSGQRDFAGNIVQPGWCHLDLPIEEGDGGDKGWAALRRR
ncbi:MAG: rhodanese-like domain-containing protein, partial [Thermoanaerobaculia bacterium]|nr:rhodanese-like domain-containing protein [Thermoanaerobaculia bacterium]